MENENINESEELKMLREQYSEAKEHLSGKDDIDEELIRNSIRNDLNYINRNKWICVFLLPIIFWAILYYEAGPRVKLLTAIMAILTLLIITVRFIIESRRAKIIRLEGKPTSEFLQEVKKQEKAQFRSFNYSLAGFILLFGVVLAECIASNGRLIILGCVVVIAAILCMRYIYRLHNRIIGIYEGIILELENPEAAKFIRKKK